jgi:hypothetical protein
MITIDVRNVNDALSYAMRMFKQPSFGRKVSPRGMVTIEAEKPVVTVYNRPDERVLFNQTRNANPFLHFFGSLWMLAGRQDAKFLAEFAPRMVDFTDDGKVLWGAYGARWKSWFDTDQLADVLKLLRHDPDSRRAVLAMWDPSRDLQDHKDIPCNTHVYFKLRDNHLDMTVCCRSNDMLWGCYGADVVDFSMLLEYMKCKLDVDMGTYTHLSDSFHVYLPPHPSGKVWAKCEEATWNHSDDLYNANEVKPFPLGAEGPEWDEDLQKMFQWYDGKNTDIDPVTPFFKQVVAPMWKSWFSNASYDRRVEVAMGIAASDWRTAAVNWLVRKWKKGQ